VQPVNETGVGKNINFSNFQHYISQEAQLYPHIMQLHGASDLDQRCLKTRNSNDGCTVPPNIFASTPKIIPKHHFGGPFNAKTYYTDSLAITVLRGVNSISP